MKLEKDQVYLLKPTKITKTNKKVNSQKFGGMCDRYDIVFVDKNAEVVECEWLCCGPENVDFFVGVFRYVKVAWVSGRDTATIEPCEEPGDKITPSAPSDKLHERIDTRNTPAVNPYNVNVSGKSLTFGFAYAKDLKVAEIALRGWNAKVTEEDIEDVIRWGGKIATGMVDQLDF